MPTHLLNSPLSNTMFRGLCSVAKSHIELIILILLVIGYILFNLYRSHSAEVLVHDLRQSDFVFIDYLAIDPDSDRRFHYIPMKVLQITDEEVLFKVGNIAYDGPVSPREHVQFDRPLLLRNFYRKDTITLTRQKIIQFFRDNVIYDVRRPNGIYLDGWIVIPRREAVL